VKDDIENNDANGLKRFPELASSHSIPSKRIRDIVGDDADMVGINWLSARTVNCQEN